MDVTFLGTGSAIPSGDRFQTGLLLESDDAETLLVDCGSGVAHALAGTETGIGGISTIILTHHHPDHVDDLLAILIARWLSDCPETEIVGPEGTAALLEGYLDCHGDLKEHIDPDVREIEPGSFAVAGYDVEAVETDHSVYCLAYRFESGGAAFTFSADTEPSAAVADLADGSAVLAHDCSFPDGIDVGNHSTPTGMGKALAGTEIGRIYLTHLYPHTDGRHEEMTAAAEEYVDCDVRVARDGLTVRVTAEQ